MLTKYEQKDLAMIKLILERGKLKDGKEAIARWISKAGDNTQARERRTEAADRLLGAFVPAVEGQGTGRASKGS